MSNETCKWRLLESGYWKTACGLLEYFEYGGPRENAYVFCPFCGKEIDIHGGETK